MSNNLTLSFYIAETIACDKLNNDFSNQPYYWSFPVRYKVGNVDILVLLKFLKKLKLYAAVSHIYFN